MEFSDLTRPCCPTTPHPRTPGQPDGYGEARGARRETESADGREAGRGRGVVAGAPWAEAADGLVVSEECSGENGALNFENPSKFQ